MSEPIVASQKDHLGIITFNRPDVFNSVNRELALAFLKAMEDFGSDSNIRAILIVGNGKAFCAGQDLQEAIDPNGPGIDKIVNEHYNPMAKIIRRVEKPVIAAINGVAAGAGANLALICDVVVAAKSASFIQAFSKIGLIPDTGGTFSLPRIIGFQKASALMMTGDKVSADEAEGMNMIYKVFPDESFMEDAEVLGQKLANMPTKGLAYTKYLLNKSATSNLEDQLERERTWQYRATLTKDSEEGINAFLEKRAPKFTGE